MSFTYTATEGATQGELASSYTNALTAYLQSPEGADIAAYLAYVSGSTVEEAIALKTAIMNGEFSLSGLFGAAQSKTGEVDGANVTDPVPTLTVGNVTIDLSAMLGELETASWDTVTKKDTITHTREFYSESSEPDGYSTDWTDPVGNQAPTAEAIVLALTEYDEHAEANEDPVIETVNLLAGASDPDGDALSVVADSVTLSGGDDLPEYISYADGILSIDLNHTSLDDLYLGDEWTVPIEYQITDGNYTISNTVDLTITGTADQFTDSTKITIEKIGDDAYTESGSYALLGFDWSNGSVDVTGYGDYDFKNESFTVSGDVDSNYTGLNSAGKDGIANYENNFITVDPTQELDTDWSDDGYLDYSVAFTGAVDGYTDADLDASEVSIELTYDYWM